MSAASTAVSVVVPCYASAEMLPALFARIRDVLEKDGSGFELILVEDRGPDRDATWDVIQRLAHEDARVRGFRVLKNGGQHNALLLGIRQAKHDIIVTLDDDMQNPPEEMPRLLRELEDKKLDLVYGTPRKKQHGLVQNLGSAAVRSALWLATKSPQARFASPYRAFRTRVRNAFSSYNSPFVSIDALISWGATNVASIPVDHADRAAGQSNQSLRTLLRHAVTMIVAFSNLPLALTTIAGAVSLLFGAGLLAYAVIGRLTGVISVPGFAFTLAAISIFSGAQMATLGILGEYIGRIYARSQDRPPYVVDDATERTDRTEKGA
jgi:undecaprenyl-phosphate 4-deoxy-4-formamido-L-arabinose transferase